MWWLMLRWKSTRQAWLAGVCVRDGILPGSAYKTGALELPVVETLNSAIDSLMGSVVNKGAIGL